MYGREVAAIIVTHNRLELLKDCIYSLENQTKPLSLIIIVDTCSTDGTRTYLKKLEADNKTIVAVLCEKNIGGSGGFCLGIKSALNLGYYDIWLMDDDTVPSLQALESLAEARKKLCGNFGFLVSVAEWEDGSLCNMNIPLCVSKYETTQYYPELIELKQATFVSMLISHEAIIKVGLPITEFFIWGDDQEYSRRISDYFPCYWVMNSKVEHRMKHNLASDISADDKCRIERYFYKYRNEFYIARHRTFISVGYYLFRVLRDILRVLIWAKSNKWQRIKIIMQGLLYGFSFEPSIEMIGGDKDESFDSNSHMDM